MVAAGHLFRIADRLNQVELGSAEADRTNHEILGREGPVLAYTRNEAAAPLLLPDGFEWREDTNSGGMVYAACRRQGLDEGLPYPHHSQWGRTSALAMCGAVMRTCAVTAKG